MLSYSDTVPDLWSFIFFLYLQLLLFLSPCVAAPVDLFFSCIHIHFLQGPFLFLAVLGICQDSSSSFSVPSPASPKDFLILIFHSSFLRYEGPENLPLLYSLFVLLIYINTALPITTLCLRVIPNLYNQVEVLKFDLPFQFLIY